MRSHSHLKVFFDENDNSSCRSSTTNTCTSARRREGSANAGAHAQTSITGQYQGQVRRQVCPTKGGHRKIKNQTSDLRENCQRGAIDGGECQSNCSQKAVAKEVPVAGSAAHQEPAKAALASAAKPAKNAKKPKMVRDTFTIPKSEYAVLNDLKQRAAQLSQGVKKSELLWAGIKALAAMSEAAFLTALQRVPAVKTGRPAPSN